MDSDTPHVVNLINSVIGVGILAMPFCFSKCGLLLGILVLVYSAWATYTSGDMLMNSAKAKKKKSYEYLSLACFGPQGKFSVEFAQIGLMLGTCIAFYIVISSLLTDVFGDWWQEDSSEKDLLTLRQIFTIILGFFIVLPLGLMRDLSKIAYFAYFSSFFYCFFISVVFYKSVSAGLLTFDWVSKVEWWVPSGIFRVLPIFALAFTCQSQLFIIYASMDNPPVSRMNGIMRKMISLVASVYLVIGLLGYSMFASEVKGNMLLNFPNDFLLKIIKFGFALSVIVGFPLMIYPCRQSIFTCFVVSRLQSTYGALKNDESGQSSGGQTMAYIPDAVFRALTLGIVIATMTVALIVENVETILGLNGSLMGSFIAFILPSLCYQKSLGSELSSLQRKIWRLVFFTGVGALILGVVQNLPKAEVLEVEQYPDHVIQQEFESMEQLLSEPKNPKFDSISRKSVLDINKYPKPLVGQKADKNLSSEPPDA